MAIGVGVIFLWYSILTRGSLYIETVKLCQFGYFYYTNVTEICLPGNSKKFVFDGCWGGGSHFYGIIVY